MNTAVQTQELSHHFAPIKPRAAKKVASELKPKPRTTSAKKEVLLSAKRSTSKLKPAGKARSSAKAAPRKVKPILIKNHRTEQIAAPELPPPSVQLPIQEPQSATSKRIEQIELLTMDVPFEPMRTEDQPEIQSGLAFESISGGEPIQPVTAAASISTPEFVDLNEPDFPAETVALSEGNALTAKAPASKIVNESRSAPLVTFWRSMATQLTELWNWALAKFKSHQVRKRLRVCETVSLGEKRFLAVVQVDGEQFLVGGSSSSVSTLAHLERSRDFSDVFHRHCEQDLSQA